MKTFSSAFVDKTEFSIEQFKYLAAQLESGLTAVSRLQCVQEMASITSLDMTVAESKMLAFSMEGIRNELGGKGNPIVVQTSSKGRKVAIESLSDWGRKANETLKAVIKKLLAMIKAFLAKLALAKKALIGKIRQAKAKFQEDPNAEKTLRFPDSRNLILDNRQNRITVAVLAKNFQDNAQNLRKYIHVVNETFQGHSDGTLFSGHIVDKPPRFLGGWVIDPDGRHEIIDTTEVIVHIVDPLKELDENGAFIKEMMVSFDVVEKILKEAETLGNAMMKVFTDFGDDVVEKTRVNLKAGIYGGVDHSGMATRSQTAMNFTRHTNIIISCCQSHMQGMQSFFTEAAVKHRGDADNSDQS